MVSVKRGQVTLFVIVGIVIALALIGYFVFQGSAEARYFAAPGVKEGVDSIKASLTDCLLFTSESALTTIMYQGGYHQKPQYATEYVDTEVTAFIPYYYYEGEALMPSLSVIESEFASEVSERIPSCAAALEASGFTISHGSVTSTVSIQDDEVVVTVDMPLTIEHEGHTLVLEASEYPVHIQSKLARMHTVAQAFVEDVAQSGDARYCVNCLGDAAIANDVFVDVIPLDATTTSVIITDEVEPEGERFIYYVFLAKFSEAETTDDVAVPFA